MVINLSPQVEKALAMLNDAGFEAYLVGGAVRDLCLVGCSHVKDWDIATAAGTDEIKTVFAGFRIIETGIKHGTVTVIVDGEPLEITTFRHGDSLRQDLIHRDFTMNTLAYHREQGVIDLYGGAEDFKKRKLRCVGSSLERFCEDPLRILRGLRFASVLDMDIDEEAAAAMRRNKDLLQNVAVERIRNELTQMLCGPSIGRILREFSDVLAVPLPEIQSMIGFEQYHPYHCYDIWGHTVVVVEKVPAEPVLAWAALFHDMGKPFCFSRDPQGVGHFYGHAAKSAEIADRIMERLKFDHVSRKEISFLVEHHDRSIAPNEKSVKRALRQYGVERLSRLIRLGRADTLGHTRECWHYLEEFDQLEQMIQFAIAVGKPFSREDLAVNGKDLIQLGYEGPAIGEALNLLVDAVICDDLKNEKDSLITYLRKRKSMKQT